MVYRILFVCAVLCSGVLSVSADFSGREYDFTRQRLFSGFDGKFCKIAPEVASDGHGLALMTWEKLLLTGSDVFYGTYLARSEDDGLTWGEPVRQEILADTWEGEIRVARNACIRYSAKNRRWFALGHESLYKDDKRPFQQVVNGRPFMRPLYVSVDAARGALTNVTYLAFPFACAGAMPFGQIAECDNGDIIVPFYLQEKGADPKNPYVLVSKCVTVRYAFEGDALKVVKAGTPISVPGLLRGVGEPSLVRAGSKFYITLRSDERGMFAESDDGLTFGEPQPWRWENGEEIGNRNTQQHWIHGANAIYLAYTRETPWNGHVFRNRAPIFAAKFDPVRKCLVRETEFALTPELGTRSGNFCIADVRDESWLVTAEWMQGLNGALGTCERYGADNSLWLVKTRFGGTVGGRRNLLMSGETPPAAVVEMLPKVASAMGCELEVTVEGKTLPGHPATGRWDYVTMRRPFVDFQKMRNEGSQFCLRYANALPKAEIVVVEPLDYAQHRGAYDFANEKSLRVAPVGTAVRLLDGMAGGVVDANAPKYAYLESLVWVAKLFEVDVSECLWAPPALAADEAKRICRAAQDAVNGVVVPLEKGGAVIPPDVAAGMARIRASDEPRCRVREVEYSPERGVRVFLQLKPTTISTIRCEVRLPDPRKWDGRFWGNGCGGWPEMRTDYIVNPSDSVEMKCDMGTLRFPIGKAPVHPEVRKDFGWRATHLSTLAAKRLVKLFYGRDPDHSYFYGSSTGGRQATAEARRFPADYDGVIAGVPALEPVCHAMPGWRIAQLKRTYGTWFTPEQIKAVRQAELDYFAKTDPEIARGKFICDPLPTKEKLDGCWAEALKSDPSIAPLEKMWRELFEPITACGRRLCPGFVIGAEFNAPNSASEFMLDSILGAKPLPEATEADLVRLQDDADYTMRDADLTAFAARGGKFITFAGLEDGSIPPLPVTEHYCRAVGTLGAAVVTNFFVHYLIPGRQHSPGRWSAHGATGDPANLRGTIQDWVERGVRPSVLTVPFLDEPGKAIKVAPYPSVGVVSNDAACADVEPVEVRVRQTPTGPRVFVDGKPVRSRFYYGSPATLCNISWTWESQFNLPFRAVEDTDCGRVELPLYAGEAPIDFYNADLIDLTTSTTNFIGGRVRTDRYVCDNLKLVKDHVYRFRVFNRANHDSTYFRYFTTYRRADGAWAELPMPYGDTLGDTMVLAAKEGVNLITFSTDSSWGCADWWNEAGDEQGFKRLDDLCARLIAINPKALLIPRIIGNAPDWFLEKHPESRTKFDRDYTVGMVSVSYRPYRTAICEMVEKLTRHLQRKFPRNFAGLHVGGQSSAEWFYFNSLSGDLSGYDVGTREAFGGEVPSFVTRRTVRPGKKLDPVKDKRLHDFSTFRQIEIASLLRDIGAAIRRGSDGKCLALFFYGYTWELASHRFGSAELGHNAMEWLQREGRGMIDGFSAPFSYCDRNLMGSASVMSAAESCLRKGFLWINEEDARTCREEFWDKHSSAFKRHTDLWTTEQILLRDSIADILRGYGEWWMDLFGRGWHRDAEMWKVRARLNPLDDAFFRRTRPYEPEIAAVMDEASLILNSALSDEYMTRLRRRECYARSGGTYGQFFFDDLLTAPPPSVKLVYLLSCDLTGARAAKLAVFKAAHPNVVFIEATPNDMKAEVVAEHARRAGVHLYTAPNQAYVEAAEGYVMVQARQEGPLSIDFGATGEIADAFTGARVGRGPKLTIPFRKGEVRLFRHD